MKTGLAIVSGGMDSVTMLYEYAVQIGLVCSFDYGSKHNNKELPFARLHAKQLGIEYIQIPLEFINTYFSSNLLKSGQAIPDGHYEDAIMKKTVVPFRNGIMLSIAAGLAESRGLTQVFIANHFGDHAIYPDCRVSFIQPMTEAIQQGTYANINLVSPYAEIIKRTIALKGKEFDLDYSQTWSCYKGEDFHCGTCGTCVERREALKGFDNTKYVSN